MYIQVASKKPRQQLSNDIPKSNGITKSTNKIKSDEKRLEINKKERERTLRMNNAFNKLKNALDVKKKEKSETKFKTLELTKLYINFLYSMKTNDEFFKRYYIKNYSLVTAFHIFLLQNDYDL